MSPRWTGIAYLAAAAATTLAAAGGRRRAHVVTKVALMPLLAGDVLLDPRTAPTRRAPLMVALAGAWVGDTVLALPTAQTGGDPVLERRRLRQGAAAFAVQQGIYLTLLSRNGARPRVRSSAPSIGALLGAAVLDSGEGTPPDPVLVGYGLLLGTTGCLAAGSVDAGTRWGGRLFVASDVAILIRSALLRADPAQRAAQGFVLGTYAAAQLLLTRGLRART